MKLYKSFHYKEKTLEVNNIIEFFKRKLYVCKCVSLDEMIVMEN